MEDNDIEDKEENEEMGLHGFYYNSTTERVPIRESPIVWVRYRVNAYILASALITSKIVVAVVEDISE